METIKTNKACKSRNLKSGQDKFANDGCTVEDHNLASTLKALAHPIRLRILRMLGESETSMCACDIEAQFSLRQPSISHHMKILKEAGFVESWQEKNWVRYRLAANPPVPINTILSNGNL